jgi:hypothetical protein
MERRKQNLSPISVFIIHNFQNGVDIDFILIAISPILSVSASSNIGYYNSISNPTFIRIFLNNSFMRNWRPQITDSDFL